MLANKYVSECYSDGDDSVPARGVPAVNRTHQWGEKKKKAKASQIKGKQKPEELEHKLCINSM